MTSLANLRRDISERTNDIINWNGRIVLSINQETIECLENESVFFKIVAIDRLQAKLQAREEALRDILKFAEDNSDLDLISVTDIRKWIEAELKEVGK